MYQYESGRSLFKLCDIGATLGSTIKYFYEAKEAGQDCKDVNLYKCALFCAANPGCKSILFYEGPMDSDLKVPRYLCTELKTDLDEAESAQWFPNDKWQDLQTFTCAADYCTGTSCVHKNSDDITACQLRQYLKTRLDDDIDPLIKRTGSILLFKDHLGPDVFFDIQSKLKVNLKFGWLFFSLLHSICVLLLTNVIHNNHERSHEQCKNKHVPPLRVLAHC